MNIKLSIIIPCYNEKKTILNIIKKLHSLKINKELIVVDDCSFDGSYEIIKNNKHLIDRLIRHDKNIGKGGAIKSAKKYINGDYVVIQDADEEYFPEDLTKMIKIMMENNYKALYGSRVLGKNRYFKNEKFTSIFRIFGNHILTIFSNFINKQNITDAHTCYKMFKTEVFNSIELKENDFAFCPEITTKISNLKIKIYEIEINYNGRTFAEGKKISFKDGFKAIKAILKYKK